MIGADWVVRKNSRSPDLAGKVGRTGINSESIRQGAWRSLKFRPDLDGVRALAVLPVLFFHAQIPLFSGGFLGVDVFFVISGYLITEKLLDSFRRGTFTIAGFYDNRIRRIIPALLFVSGCTIALSPLFMLPYTLRNFGESLVATMLSANNILLYLTSGYWGVAAEFKPFYHTWSLGVEEQYYFFAPLLLYLLYRRIHHRDTAMRGVICLLLAISFVVTLVTSDKEFKFLIIYFRAWELMAGALLALSSSGNRSHVLLSALGVMLLLTSYVSPHIVGDNQALVVAVPVIGTCLIIRYSSIDNVTGKLLSFRPLTFIGLISYSVYLWHQPILAFLRLSSVQEPGPFTLLAFSLFSLPLGYISWRYVERLFRNKEMMPARACYAILGAGAGLTLIMGFLLYRSFGFQDLMPQFAYGANPQIYVDKAREFSSISFNGTKKRRTLVVGNSFARDYINMMRETGFLETLDVVYFEGTCADQDSQQLDALLAASDLVILSNDWGRQPGNDDIAGAYSCYKSMRQSSAARVVVIGTKNFGWNNDFVKFARGRLTDIRVTPIESVRDFNLSAKALIGTDYVDIMGLISDQDGKVPVFTPEGKFITYDGNHLTKAGARYVGEAVFNRFNFLVGT